MNADSGKKSQQDRFEAVAKELGVDLDEDRLKETLRKIAPDKPERDPKKED